MTSILWIIPLDAWHTHTHCCYCYTTVGQKKKKKKRRRETWLDSFTTYRIHLSPPTVSWDSRLIFLYTIHNDNSILVASLSSLVLLLPLNSHALFLPYSDYIIEEAPRIRLNDGPHELTMITKVRRRAHTSLRSLTRSFNQKAIKDQLADVREKHISLL